MKKSVKSNEIEPPIYKSYTTATGTYMLTKEEFDAIVSYFRKIKRWRDTSALAQERNEK